MQLTKLIFDQLQPGEIFRTVITRMQSVHDPMRTVLTFVCVKGRSGLDWAIYAGLEGAHPNDIARYGDKVVSKENILSICPCDEEIMQLYRK